MAPIKFEEHIKDKLEERALTPSPDSWAKLSGRLNEEEQKATNTKFWWLGAVASIVLLVSVSVYFFLKSPNVSNLPVVVEETMDTTKQNLPIKPKIEIEKQNIQLVEETLNDDHLNSEKVSNTKLNQAQPKQKDSPNQNEILKQVQYKKTNRNQLTHQSKTAEQESITKETAFKSQEELSITKQVIAEALNDTKTDKEVDSLLKLASKALLIDKAMTKKSNVVSAEDLLLSVEDDLEKSFRTKAFEALKSGFETVKTAVADRNN